MSTVCLRNLMIFMQIQYYVCEELEMIIHCVGWLPGSLSVKSMEKSLRWYRDFSEYDTSMLATGNMKIFQLQLEVLPKLIYLRTVYTETTFNNDQT